VRYTQGFSFGETVVISIYITKLIQETEKNIIGFTKTLINKKEKKMGNVFGKYACLMSLLAILVCSCTE